MEKQSGTKPVEQMPTMAAPQSTISPVPEQKVVHKLPETKSTKMKSLLVGVIVILAGVGTGYMLSGASAKGTTPAPTSNVAENPESPEVDETVFSDTAVGTLHEGGIEGEGTHYLDTGAGEEKYVYLLSTVLNLDSFVGKKVEVAGQTLAAEHAGWLMDVGRIKEVK